MIFFLQIFNCKAYLIYFIHTHTHTHTRARAHTHTHTHIYIYIFNMPIYFKKIMKKLYFKIIVLEKTKFHYNFVKGIILKYRCNNPSYYYINWLHFQAKVARRILSDQHSSISLVISCHLSHRHFLVRRVTAGKRLSRCSELRPRQTEPAELWINRA